jgi:alpha-beta hydrolase superfamily lysophospholipase
MASIEQQVTARDGTPLLVRDWPAPDEEPWASVLIVHGLGEHSGRYEHVGAWLRSAGLESHAYDHRGMGGSGGRRGDVERWPLLHDDLADRLAAVRAAAGPAGRPVVLFGHSLGGLIAAGYCLSARPTPDYIVLSAPGLDAEIPAWKRGVAQVLGRVLPTLSIPNGIDGALLSRDPSVGERTVEDPRCVKTSTARFASLAFAEQARVRTAAPGGLGRPTLVYHGSDDRLVPTAASAVFEGAPDTTRRVWPGLRHESHNEPEGRQVIDAVVAWLRERVGSTERAAV